MRGEITNYCAVIGNDPLLVQGAGGNVSWKEGDTLWVKASGTWLADAAAKEIFVPVALGHLREAMARDDFETEPQTLRGSVLRPSIETMLHALLPHNVVVHVHAVEILAHLVRLRCERAIASSIGRAVEWGATGYHKPGAELARAVNAVLEVSPLVDAIFLQNHGIVVGGRDVAATHRVLRTIIDCLAVPERESAMAVADSEDVAAVEACRYHRVPLAQVQRLATDAFYFHQLPECWALYPDHVVFLGPAPVVFNDARSFVESLQRSEHRPELIFVNGVGVFERENLSEAKHAYLQCYYDVMSRQCEDTALAVLEDAEIAALLDWDAEKFRQAGNAMRVPVQPPSLHVFGS